MSTRLEVAPRTGTLANISARDEHRHESIDWTRKCQMFTRTRFDAPPRDATATEGWKRAVYRHPGDLTHIPFGVAGYFINPRDPRSAGHAVFMAGGHRAWSNDIKVTGEISLTTIDFILFRWRQYEWAGWVEDVNGFRVWGHGPSISVGAVATAQRHGAGHPRGRLIKQQLAAIPGIGRSGMRLSDDKLGHPFDDAVRELQHKHDLKPTGLVGPRVLGLIADHHSAFTTRP
jgi:hypothetical protein